MSLRAPIQTPYGEARVGAFLRMKRGFCALCQEVRIMEAVEGGGVQTLPNYCEHFVELSNGSIMRIGICEDCRPRLISGKNVLQNAKKILDLHKEFWRSENPHGNFDDLDIADPNTDEQKHLQKKLAEEKSQSDALDSQKENHYRELEIKQAERLEVELRAEQERIESEKEEKAYMNTFQAIQL